MYKAAGTHVVDHKTVLVIEDSPTQALHMQALLEQEGLKVILARDGWTGLQMARKSPPDVIVLDLEMSGMNGLQVCQRLKGTHQTVSIPVIMLTRHSDPEVVTLGIQLGAVDYISKDAFAEASLLETLRQMGLIVSHAGGSPPSIPRAKRAAP